MTTESDLEQRILRCVDDGLQPLGDSVQHVIYHYLENCCGLKREEIPRKPEKFCNGLTLLFGEEGADVIEKWIIEKLRKSFDLKKRSNITLTEAVVTIKTHG